MDVLDDDSENDSDYVPGEDDPEDEKEIDEEGNKQVTEITFSRKRKALSLWEELQQEEKASLEKHSAKALHVAKPSSAPKKVKANQQILASIFGSKVANKLSSGGGGSAKDNVSSDEIKKRIKLSVENIQKKTTVTETRKFAGEAITVTKSVSSKNLPLPPKSTKKADAIDGVLEALKGPKVVSTISKSSVDWDNYKEKEGLEDDLAAAAKEGYLARKDFLNRCDVRAFENERDERLATRKNN